MMTCREVYGFLDEFLDGRLDIATRLKFGSHLLVCPACRTYLETYRATLQAARGSEWADAPTDVPPPEDLIHAILASRAAALASQPPE